MEVVVVFPLGHDDEGILEVRFPPGLFAGPYFVEGLSAYTTREMGVELLGVSF